MVGGSYFLLPSNMRQTFSMKDNHLYSLPLTSNNGFGEFFLDPLDIGRNYIITDIGLFIRATVLQSSVLFVLIICHID